jgi:hypothetical protein
MEMGVGVEVEPPKRTGTAFAAASFRENAPEERRGGLCGCERNLA